MLAINHVGFATAAVLAVSVYYNQPFYLPFLIFVIFSALLPDIDHRNSEISRLAPFFHRLFGHRKFTHSLLGTLCFVGIAYLAFRPSEYITYGLLALGYIGIFYLYKVMRLRSEEVDYYTHGFFSKKQLQVFLYVVIISLLIVMITASLTVYKQYARDQIFVLLVFGYVTHIIGDFLTKDGVPIFWPSLRSWGLRIFRTGSGFETLLGLILMVANVYFFVLFIQTYRVDSWSYWSHYLDSPFIFGFDIRTLLK